MHEQHAMSLESVSPIGTEEWFCPACERRLLRLKWHPEGKQIVVKPGDEHAHGNAAPDGLPETAVSDGYALSREEEKRLAPWVAWLKEVDLESWWNDPTG